MALISIYFPDKRWGSPDFHNSAWLRAAGLITYPPEILTMLFI